MARSDDLFAQASTLEKKAQEINKEASEARQQELKELPLSARMVYSAFLRCPCGAGIAYDPLFEDNESVFSGPLSGHWDCSAILLGTADKDVRHTDKLPFAFYEICSERQASACGATTRTEEQPQCPT